MPLHFRGGTPVFTRITSDLKSAARLDTNIAKRGSLEEDFTIRAHRGVDAEQRPAAATSSGLPRGQTGRMELPQIKDAEATR